jgi:hypothetical protein
MAALTLCADKQTLAWVSGTIFGRDVLPEVNRIKASSALDAKSPATMRLVADPTMLSAPGSSLGRVARSMRGIPSLRATSRQAESMSERVTSAAARNSPK